MNAASREECARLEDLGLDVVGFEAICFGACPTQKGLLLEPPHLQYAYTVFPSTTTRFGPFSVERMTISGIRRWFGDDVNFAC